MTPAAAAAPRRVLPAVVGVAAVALALAAVAAAAVIDAAVPAAHRAATQLDLGWVAGVAGAFLCAPGALLLHRLPRHPVAWVLLITGVHWAVDGLACAWLAYATLSDPALPGAGLAFWLYQRLGASLLLSLPLILLLYPDGRLPRGRWRVAALAGLASTALLPLVLLFTPSTVAQADSGVPLPAAFAGLDLDPTTIGLPTSVWAPVLAFAGAMVPVSLVVPFAVVLGRYRRSAGDPRRRARMRWLLWAAVVDVLVMLAMLVLPQALTSIGLTAAVGLTGIALTVGIVAPQLVDIDRLLGGTILYAAMALSVLVVDACVLGVASTVLGERLAERDAAVLALLLVTAVYGPLRQRLWVLARRLVRGRRDDPYGVVAGLAEQLERQDRPEEQLVAVARSVAAAFKVPYVAVEVDRPGGESVVAAYGTAPGDTQVLPIAYRDETVGRLVLPSRRASLSARDGRLLGDMVRQAAIAARTAYLAAELQRGRERIVAAREEERRRLRRDLHDGLGPTLGGVALRIDTARNLAARKPEEADRLLRQAREDVTTALADVRRLVHDLRPPALDDVGLLGAVRQQAARLRVPGLTVTVEGEDLEGLPAAAEVAAYRIASEALANVARHAGAATAKVRLSRAGDDLVVEIADDGVGIPAGTPTGVGLVSLRERAAELGGDCRIECPDGGGTVVTARLPLGLGAEVAHG
ncbi:histidine kinase/DNA gyrase B/HSP90-like ATPase [Couchioplanes caeruleus]|uniref:Oxygen sensor histidine kinase NreB n=1 Tax=Couchioplanes caeruleus TaxID=56438 RepID=A0A3N1GS51_9ACTN|nr:histidine kinase/DNA gyrase B/HSP90-like ATPase [Couchioplanes caeruleus]